MNAAEILMRQTLRPKLMMPSSPAFEWMLEQVLAGETLVEQPDPTEGLPLYINAAPPLTDAAIERLAAQEM